MKRSYWYARGEYVKDDTMDENSRPQCHDGSECVTPQSDFPRARVSYIDNTMTNETAVPKLKNGVKVGEGDGTVSLLSLGAMCVEGWRRKRWNPGGVKIITHEVTIPSGASGPYSSSLLGPARARSVSHTRRRFIW
jgi:phospholipid:diacylglycerol acyltransferase